MSDLEQRGTIGIVESSELEMYLEIYNNANLRKAHGIAEAVRRGLILGGEKNLDAKRCAPPPLADET